MLTRAFLLERAHDVSVVENETWFYDDQFEVNTIIVNGINTLACTASTAVTGSKTNAAPGDDDPDPDVEFMY